MIKVQVFEVSRKLRTDTTFTIKAEMLDLDDAFPSTAKKYVMVDFETYESLTGSKIKIVSKPRKRKLKLDTENVSVST